MPTIAPTDEAGTPPARAPARPAFQEAFRKLASRSANAVGSPWAFGLAFALVIGWAVTGPLFEWSETWQLVINTGTTIVTFLIVFLIQATQNRDARAIHLKLDELIRTTHGRVAFEDLEDASDAVLDAFQHEFKRLRTEEKAPVDDALERARKHVRQKGPHRRAHPRSR